MSDHARRAADAVKRTQQAVHDRLSLWREQVTSLTAGLLPLTTGYEPAATEGVAAWQMVDALDMLAVGDELVLGDFGGVPLGLGKLRRGAAAGPVRINRQVAFPGSAPTVAANSGAGSGATATITGSDTGGRVTVKAGTSPAAGFVVTITFATPRANTGYAVLLGNADPNAADLHAYVDFADVGTTRWRLQTRSAMTAGASYHWGYFVFGHTAAG